MIDENDQLVFFEGNQSTGRLYGVMFLNLGNFMEFITDFFWPFDDK